MNTPPWTAPSFAAAIPSLEDIRTERYLLMTRAGLSYTDWRQMARWQRVDHLARWQLEAQKKADKVKKNWKEIIGLIVGRLIGVS